MTQSEIVIQEFIKWAEERNIDLRLDTVSYLTVFYNYLKQRGMT